MAIENFTSVSVMHLQFLNSDVKVEFQDSYIHSIYRAPFAALLYVPPPSATLLFAVPPQKSLTKYNSKVSLSSFRSSSLPTMSDDEGDVHVCDICQEIFLGTDELEQHMKEDHADKEVGLLKQQITKHSC